jgi:hypothetical protein
MPTRETPKERGARLERWLREDVAATYDAMKADPARGLPAAHVFDAVRARHAARLQERDGQRPSLGRWLVEHLPRGVTLPETERQDAPRSLPFDDEEA